jgi:hypothetical protein
MYAAGGNGEDLHSFSLLPRPWQEKRGGSGAGLGAPPVHVGTTASTATTAVAAAVVV